MKHYQIIFLNIFRETLKQLGGGGDWREGGRGSKDIGEGSDRMAGEEREDDRCTVRISSTPRVLKRGSQEACVNFRRGGKTG